jgi:hypothetical protein
MTRDWRSRDTPKRPRMAACTSATIATPSNSIVAVAPDRACSHRHAVWHGCMSPLPRQCSGQDWPGMEGRRWTQKGYSS